jgi:hypothetical protein
MGHVSYFTRVRIQFANIGGNFRKTEEVPTKKFIGQIKGVSQIIVLVYNNKNSSPMVIQSLDICM